MTNRKRETYHHGDLRAALLEVAVEMIATEGTDSVTLRALGQRLGVSRTAPYRHFADKSVLLAAVATEGFKQLLQRLHVIEQQREIDSAIRFQQMGVAYIQFATENPTHYRLMFSGETASREAYPDLAKAGQAVFDILMTAIQQCQAENKIKSGSPRDLAYVAWSTVHGVASLMIDRQMQHATNLQEFATFATETLFDGLTS